MHQSTVPETISSTQPLHGSRTYWRRSATTSDPPQAHSSSCSAQCSSCAGNQYRCFKCFLVHRSPCRLYLAFSYTAPRTGTSLSLATTSKTPCQGTWFEFCSYYLSTVESSSISHQAKLHTSQRKCQHISGITSTTMR
jgi:hypothetical protein